MNRSRLVPGKVFPSDCFNAFFILSPNAAGEVSMKRKTKK